MRRIHNRLLIALLAGLLTVVVLTCFPGSTHYHIREAYSFRAGDKDAGVRLAVMMPTTGPYQQVRNLVISWDGTQARESEGTVEVVKVTGQVKAGQEKIGAIAYDVILRRGPAQWKAPVEDFQLQPQPGIESDAPAIVQAASQTVAGQSRKDAYRIHKFTAGQLRGVAKAARIRTCVSSQLSRLTKGGKGFADIMQT